MQPPKMGWAEAMMWASATLCLMLVILLFVTENIIVPLMATWAGCGG